MIINRERLATTFTELCEISSPSRQEGKVAQYLTEVFTKLGATTIHEDNSAASTGSDTGNIIVSFAGNRDDRTPFFFACHMDTVTPADNIEVARNGSLFTSATDTILGGDDKSGIAALIELITLLKENGAEHGPMEFIFTTCEEIGLLGAKGLDHSKIKATYGYALDATGIDTVITKAPAANDLKVTVHGLAAHAGLSPEQGVNAFSVAATAIATLRLGRLDDESTSNFGIIQGGKATNIVPDLITLKGEVRSHSEEKLAAYTDEIRTTFTKTIENWSNPFLENKRKPSVEIEVHQEYAAMSIPEDGPAIQHAQKASAAIDKKLDFIATGGGSDANVFNTYGLETAILATGMNKVHTLEEEIDLDDMVKLTELIYSLALHQ